MNLNYYNYIFIVRMEMTLIFIVYVDTYQSTYAYFFDVGVCESYLIPELGIP